MKNVLIGIGIGIILNALNKNAIGNIDTIDTYLSEAIIKAKVNIPASYLIRHVIDRGKLNARKYNEFGKELYQVDFSKTSKKAKDLQFSQVVKIISKYLD